MNHRLKISDMYIPTLIFSVCFNGILSNFLPSLGGLGFGTVWLDILLLLGIVLLIYEIGNKKICGKRFFFISLIFVSFSGLLLVKSGFDSNSISERILGWRNYILYASPMLVIFSKKLDVARYTKLMSVTMIVICFFAVSQYFMRDIYPESFIKLKEEENQFNFYGYDFIRVNGLIGNTIIFTGFALVSAILSFNIFYKSKNFYYLVGSVISIISLFLTFSRAAWIVGSMLLILNYLIIIRLEAKRMLLTASLLVFSSFGIYYWLDSNQDSFIYKRLFSEDASTRGSDSIHQSQNLLATKELFEQPLLGIGLGTQGSSSNGTHLIITDGWIFQTNLEFGIPLAILFMSFLIFFVIRAFKEKNKNTASEIISVSFITVSLYFLITGILNSSFTGKTTYIIYFILLGLFLNSQKKENI